MRPGTVTVVVLVGALLGHHDMHLAQAQSSTRTIAVAGQQADDLPAGITYLGRAQARRGMLNSSGQIAFSESVTGPGVTPANQSGIWMGTPGDVHLVARGGAPAPGAEPGANLGNLSLPLINDGGDVIFAGSFVHADGGFGAGIWRGQPGAIELVARNGDRAPGTPDGVTFTSFDVVDFNAQGQAIVNASLTGSGITPVNEQGLWLLDGNSMTLVARNGDQAAGAPAGVGYAIEGQFIYPFQPALDNVGRVAFTAKLSGPGTTASNNVGLWLSESGTTTLVARQGDPASGAPAGLVYNLHPMDSNAYPQPVLNDVGLLAFQSSVAGPGVSNLNDHTIWLGTADNLDIVIRDGQIDPATGQRFARVGMPRLNNAGQFAFVGAGDNLGIWLVKDDSARLIARQGQIAPESGGRVFAAGMQGILYAGSLAINATGQVAFYSTLTTPGSGALGDGLWIDDGANQARIVTSGDSLAGRTVTFASNFGGSPQVLPFNDAGQLAFNVRFADESTGLFLYSPTVVPEPNALAICASALALLATRHRCREPSL